MYKKEKILVAMSGGIDSAISAFLMKNKGYNIIGVFIKMINENSKNEAMARNICQKLNIKFYSVNFFDIFQKEIINYFLDSYKNGITPNPCVKCNKIIKFGKLLKIAEELNIKYLATGHYAIIKNNKLFKGKDKIKDQTYFLYNLTQKQLSNILFPLGKYTKEEIKKIAKKANLPYLKKESQDICFLNKNGKIIDHNVFLKNHLKLQKGKIKTLSGKIIGEHYGLPLYTIGQRKGIEIGGDGPYYVVKLNYDTNTLYVTNNPSDKMLARDSFEIYNANWISGKSPKISFKCVVVARYRQKPEKCLIIKNKKNYIVKLDNPQRAITPGQSAVFYNKNEVIGGGIII